MQKRSRGCTAEAEQPFFIDINGEREEINVCPMRLMTPETVRMMQFYRYYKQGFLPSIGGILQQSDILLTAFEIIDNEVEKIKEQDNAVAHK